MQTLFKHQDTLFLSIEACTITNVLSSHLHKPPLPGEVDQESPMAGSGVVHDTGSGMRIQDVLCHQRRRNKVVLL